MGAIKTNNYTETEQQIYMLARAFSHPARVRMAEMLRQRPYRNVDLSQELRLSCPAIKLHLDMFKDAGLISISYSLHYYLVIWEGDRENLLSDFTGE